LRGSKLVKNLLLNYNLNLPNKKSKALCLAFFIFAIHLKKYTMGRGDKKTKKGKIFKGSFGKSRPANKPKAAAAPKKAEEKKA
jgi:30S ribosomal protein S31